MNANVMEQELVTIPAESAMQVFTTENALDPYLARIRQEIDAFVPDMSTVLGRKEIASMAYKIARSKSYLESVGKALADEAKSIPKKIDASRRLVKETLDAWRDEVRAPLDAYEAADAARMDMHRRGIERMQALADVASPDTDAATLRVLLGEVRAVPVGPECEEYETAYENTKADAIASLTRQIAARETYEADQAELAELRAMRAAREESDKIEAAKREAEENAKKAEEAAAKAKAEAEAHATRQAEEAAANARRAAEEKAAADLARAEAAAQAERDAATKREADAQRQIEDANRRAAETEARLLREADEKAEAEAEATRKREADREHRAAINRGAMEDFVKHGMSEECAKSAVKMIASKLIDHVSISY